MYKKFIIGCILVGLLTAMAPAQEPMLPWQEPQPFWFTLEMGKRHFRNGAFGDALMSFEDARRARIAHFTRMEEDFILFLSAPEVRWFGDSLEFIEWYINERNEARAAEILTELYHYYPKTSLEGSVSRVLDELDRLKSYPEAEFWLGETFRVEGELVLALSQYERALRDRPLFETPDFDLDILYKITEIHRVRSEYIDMERRAREIIEGNGASGEPRDNLWVTGSTDASPSPIRAAMMRILGNEGADRFLTIYRHNNMVTEAAHRLLGFYYYSRGRYITASEHLMFAFLIQNTVLIENVMAREFDFVYESLENLMLMIGSRPELLAFIDETEYFKTIYYLSSSLFANGRTRPASELWDFLSQSGRSGEWGDRARRAGTPFVESLVVMP